MNSIVVFSGHAHPGLARALCKRLKVPLSPSTTTTFSNDCLGVQLEANCRQADVFIVQPLVPPVQHYLVELLLMLDAARGASAARITAVIPHFAYARSDKKDAPRISIAARLNGMRDPGAPEGTLRLRVARVRATRRRVLQVGRSR